MPRTLIHSFLFAATLLLPLSCDEDPTTAERPPLLVVEGHIEAGGWPEVQVALALNANHVTQESLENYVVRWATVTVSDAERSQVLIGHYANGSIPPFIYKGNEWRGEAGHTYHLTVSYRGLEAHAVTTIPQEAPRVEWVVPKASPSADTLFSIHAQMVDPPPLGHKYLLFTQRVAPAVNLRQTLPHTAKLNTDSPYDAAPLLSFFGTLNDAAFPGSPDVPRQVQVEAFRGFTIAAASDTKNANYFRRGDVVDWRLRAVDDASYQFWQSYSSLINFSGNMFFPYTDNLRSNVEGQAVGYWCGYNSTTRRVKCE